jgi:hypothetical protein
MVDEEPTARDREAGFHDVLALHAYYDLVTTGWGRSGDWTSRYLRGVSEEAARPLHARWAETMRARSSRDGLRVAISLELSAAPGHWQYGRWLSLARLTMRDERSFPWHPARITESEAQQLGRAIENEWGKVLECAGQRVKRDLTVAHGSGWQKHHQPHDPPASIPRLDERFDDDAVVYYREVEPKLLKRLQRVVRKLELAAERRGHHLSHAYLGECCIVRCACGRSVIVDARPNPPRVHRRKEFAVNCTRTLEQR